jgi:hypothetical protein
VVIGKDILCDHAKDTITYDAVKKRRLEGILFGKVFKIESIDRDLNLFEFLRRYLSEDEKRDERELLHLWVVLAYHSTSNGRSYIQYKRIHPQDLKMKDLNDGDLILCAPVS